MVRNCNLIVFLIFIFSCSPSSNEELTKKTLSAKKDSVLNSRQIIIARRLDSLFTKLYAEGSFNGSVLVAKAGKVIYRKTKGICDYVSKRSLCDSSMFQLASVSKVITATAVLMLHDRKSLDIDKTFDFYFPDFPYKDITVKELLNHRSGLPNYIYALNKEMQEPDSKMTNKEMYRRFISKKPKLYYKPDFRFDYCNTNYALLGLLIEKVTGSSYGEFVKREIFTPLGMNNTGTINDITPNSLLATKAYDAKWRPVDLDASDYVLGDKSIYSTPYDLFLFSTALYENKLLKPKTQQLAYTAYSPEKKLSNYGYGWRMKNFNDPVKKEVYHNGWWHGYRSAFHRRLNDSLTIIILSNQLNKVAHQTIKVYQIIDGINTVEINEDDE